MRKGGFNYMKYGLSTQNEKFYSISKNAANSTSDYIIKLKIANDISNNLTKSLTQSMHLLLQSVIFSAMKAGKNK